MLQKFCNRQEVMPSLLVEVHRPVTERGPGMTRKKHTAIDSTRLDTVPAALTEDQDWLKTLVQEVLQHSCRKRKCTSASAPARANAPGPGALW